MTIGDARMATFVFLRDRINVLLAPTGCAFDVYPHGSFMKGTQVDPYGDVDVVVELCHPIVPEWRGGFEPAPGTRFGKRVKGRTPTPEFLWFKETVARALSHDFEMMAPGLGSMVAWGKVQRVLKVAPVFPGHVNADLLICQRFLETPPVSMNTADQGVIFWDGYGELQVSHPRKYIAKVKEKDMRTDGMFTQFVRHLKANHVALKHQGSGSRRSSIPGQNVPMDSSLGVSSATLEMLAYGVPNDHYSSRSLNATRKKVRAHLRGVAETERSRESFVPWDLVNDTTYPQWIEFMHGGFRMLLSNEKMWA
ncbi:hypothetical protein [Amycolatopsis decaplanina]|uniref:hypothetical protein n=1 Tax=Amycolatopsis decaplanina TaxID=208441 RepID=UPI001268047E|nr:hypothetical protein [Amycolatopsis decaplanina]